MLNHHVLLVDGFQQSGGQRLEVRDWLRSHRQTAAVLFRQQQLLHYNHKRTISDGWAQMYNRNDRSFLTLSGRENPGQCTTVGFTTDGGVLPALQGALKYVMYNRVKEHKKIHLCYWWVLKKNIYLPCTWSDWFWADWPPAAVDWVARANTCKKQFDLKPWYRNPKVCSVSSPGKWQDYFLIGPPFNFVIACIKHGMAFFVRLRWQEF